ncbi:MAG: hypothetical protein GX033_08320 [Firmicutes bacterium]|nr:hypothetical protein [Bacillota bacterium]
MFVITIGPLGKNWGKIVKLAAICLALLVIVIVVWRIAATMTGGAELNGAEEIIKATTSQLQGKGAQSFWQRWLGSLRLWFKFGF